MIRTIVVKHNWRRESEFLNPKISLKFLWISNNLV